MAETSVSGGCLCGRVRFEIELPTLFCAHCHCAMCRKAHGAGYVTWTAVPYSHFRVTAGAEALRRYDSSEHGWRSFCETCGSSLLCESTRHPDYLDIALGVLDGEIDRVPELHVFVDDRAGWTRLADGLPQLGGVTGMEPKQS